MLKRLLGLVISLLYMPRMLDQFDLSTVACIRTKFRAQDAQCHLYIMDNYKMK
jgi:hypothetical protein